MFHYQGGMVSDFENLLLSLVFFVYIISIMVFPILNCMYADEFVSLCLYSCVCVYTVRALLFLSY